VLELVLFRVLKVGVEKGNHAVTVPSRVLNVSLEYWRECSKCDVNKSVVYCYSSSGAHRQAYWTVGR